MPVTMQGPWPGLAQARKSGRHWVILRARICRPGIGPGRVTYPVRAGKGTASFGVVRAGLTRHQAEPRADGIVPSNGSGNSGLQAFAGRWSRTKPTSQLRYWEVLDAPDRKSTPCSRQLFPGNCSWTIAPRQLLLSN